MIREGESPSVVDDTVFGTLAILAIERSFSVETLVKNDADAPLIAATIVRLSKNDFWCHVLTRADDAASKPTLFDTVSPVEKTFPLCSLFGVVFPVLGHRTAEVLIAILFGINVIKNILLIAFDVDADPFQQTIALTIVI